MLPGRYDFPSHFYSSEAANPTLSCLCAGLESDLKEARSCARDWARYIPNIDGSVSMCDIKEVKNLCKVPAHQTLDEIVTLKDLDELRETHLHPHLIFLFLLLSDRALL